MHLLTQRTIAYLLALSMLGPMLPGGAPGTASVRQTPVYEETSRETLPQESIPEESQPEESQPEESQPEESQPEESRPEESQPEESQPEESQPEESQPEESQPEESQPEESQPEESQPEESQPEESQPEETEPEETEPEESQPEEEAAEGEEEPEEEYILVDEIPDDFAPPFSDFVGGQAAYAYGALPPAYDARESGNVSPVRDQEPWNTCWAFSALAVAESNLLSTGQAGQGVDLSERHLAYFFQGSAYDPLGNADGDATYLTDDYLASGNNNKFTTFALANWVGAASEGKYPYTSDPSFRGASAALDDAYHLTNAYWINARDTDSMKTCILQNGGVGLSVYYLNQFLRKDTYAYYNDSFTSTNHAITVVGWDDNYPAENFVTPPDTDGAWLCKNSYGADYGLDGYFWLSYCDAAINQDKSTAFVFEFESANNYTWNYHYDGSYGTTTRGIDSGMKAANVFTVQGSKTGADEELGAVGIGVGSADLSYTLQIYTDLTDPGNPTSGTPVFPEEQEGVIGLCGYYTVELDEPVKLRSGQTFSVVFTLYSSDGSQVQIFSDNTYQNGSWIRFVSHTAPNQSFLGDDYGWWDISEEGGVARIKAYTRELGSHSLARLSFEEDSVLLAPGDSYRQEPVKTPAGADTGSFVWYSSNRAVAEVAEDGTVTALTQGEAVIRVETLDGSVSASYLVTVKPPVQTIVLQAKQLRLLVGQTHTPRVMILPANVAEYYSVELTSSDETVVAVMGQSLKAVAPGTAQITVTVGNRSDTITVTVCLPLEGAEVLVEPATYTGLTLEPPVYVLLEGKLLGKGTDYTLSYANNVQPGTGQVTVNGIGTYYGLLRKSFPIDMPVPRITAVENEAKGIRLSWEELPGMAGYYVYRQKHNGGWQKVKTLSGAAQNTWLDTGASAGAVYRYQLRAFIKTATGEPSESRALRRIPAAQITKVEMLETGQAVNWKKVTGANAYLVHRAVDDGSAERIATLPAGQLRYLDPGALEKGHRYSYTVTAAWTEDTTTLAAASAPFPVCRPETSPALSLENEAKGIRLTWEPVPLATGYEVYRSTDGVKWSRVKTVTAPTWLDTSRSSGKTAWYRVVTLAKLGSVTYRGEPTAGEAIVRLSVPTVQKLTAVPEGFKVTWKRTAGAEGYEIWRWSGEEARMIARVAGEKTLQYPDLTASETAIRYRYTVIAVKDGDRSCESPAKAAVHPAAPVLELPANAAKGIELRWSAVAHATGYEVYRSTNGTKWSKVKTLTATTWLDTSRGSGSAAYYRVEAIAKLDGTTFRSDPSDARRITRLSVPTVRKLTELPGGFTLTWNRTAGAEGYEIWRSEGEEARLIAQVAGERTLQYADLTASETAIRYSYTVIAVKDGDHSCESPAKAAVHPAAPVLEPIQSAPRYVQLRWSGAEYATGYEVYRSADGTRWSKVKTLAAGTTAWQDTAYPGKNTCLYRVVTLAAMDGTTYRSPASNEEKAAP